MIRFATIGTGDIVEHFLKGAALVDGFRHTAVYSRSAETARAFARRHGAENIFTSLAEMTQSPLIDAVYIASPNSLHREQSLLFLRNGKHVLCEKPVSVHGYEAAELLNAARENNVVFMEAYIPLHLPQLTALRQAAAEIGEISLARFDFSQYSSKYPLYLTGELPNIFNPRFCTGALMDLGIYCVYPALILFGRPDRIHASASFLDSGADRAGSAIFEYPGMQAVLTYSKTGQTRTACEIIGSKGTITIGAISKLEDIRVTDLGGHMRQLSGREEKDIQMSYEARDFCRCIESGAACAQEYRYWNSLCRDAAEILLDMRRQAGIRFPDDN